MRVTISDILRGEALDDPPEDRFPAREVRPAVRGRVPRYAAACANPVAEDVSCSTSSLRSSALAKEDPGLRKIQIKIRLDFSRATAAFCRSPVVELSPVSEPSPVSTKNSHAASHRILQGFLEEAASPQLRMDSSHHIR
mmetsp:Transcript_147316/g.274470  ORF Transcript_147316/g.274470 Transcript_147316/m.274470 type:complete len:139 (-) Transcript_147316:113-529(-)